MNKENVIWLKPWTWRLQGHRKETNTLAFSPDGKLASVGMDNTIRIWRVPPRNFI